MYPLHSCRKTEKQEMVMASYFKGLKGGGDQEGAQGYLKLGSSKFPMRYVKGANGEP